MEIVIAEDSAAVAAEGARRIRALLKREPTAVLGLATGGTPRAMYQNLVADYKHARVSFAKATTFNLDEYVGLGANDPQSYRAYMNRELFEQIDIDMGRTHLPTCEPGADPETVGPLYEEAIRGAGGINLQILGIGENGHVGFNEPTSSLRSRTRIKTLTRATLDANSQYFSDPDKQPQIAITMGIATILEAREIVLLATGEHKATAVRQLIEGAISAMWPATILQLHEKVTVLLDPEAASKLANREYYDWIIEQRQRLRSDGGAA